MHDQINDIKDFHFDATQRGAWFIHFHNVYNMADGMMTEERIS